MTRKLLMIPMLAGLVFAASCSKDDGTAVVDEPTPAVSEAGTQSEQQPAVQKTYTFTIQAKKATSVSKIGLSEKEGGYDQTFESTDKLLLTDRDNGTEYATLDLKSGEGTTSAIFSKDFSEDEKSAMRGKSILAVIKGTEYADGVQTSTENLADAVQKYCYLVAESDFAYSDGMEQPTITLVDQRAYIEFSVTEGQKKVSLKTSDADVYSWYDVNATTHKVCLAVPGGVDYSTRFKKKALTAGKGYVYSVSVYDEVDLGQTVNGKNILWKTANETGEKDNSGTQHNKNKTGYTDEWYYDWETACKFGTDIESKDFRLPTKSELKALGTGTWTTQNSVNGREFSTDYGSVFFPAAGDNGGDGAGSRGLYWSGEPDGGGSAWYLGFYGGLPGVYSDLVDYEYSVRLVRGL